MRYILFAALVYFTGSTSWAQEMFYVVVDRPELSLTQSDLNDVLTLDDLHARYKGDWVAEYISTEITATINGNVVSVRSFNDTLSSEQKDLLNTADVGSDISTVISYMPNNNLTENTAKQMVYTCQVLPTTVAKYTNGDIALKAYIDQYIVAHLDSTQRATLENAVVKFTVSPNGSITDASVPVTSGDNALDAQLLQSICAMPNWKPAQSQDGTTVGQTIKFYISNTAGNCMMAQLIEGS